MVISDITLIYTIINIDLVGLMRDRLSESRAGEKIVSIV